MKKKLYVVDSYFAAKNIIPLTQNKNHEIICLNESLVFYLRSKKIKAKSIFEYFQAHEINQIKTKSQIILEKNINILDQEVKKNFFLKKIKYKTFLALFIKIILKKHFIPIV